jgi:hypothetical protein
MLIYGWVYLLLDRLESLVILGNSFLVVLEVWVKLGHFSSKRFFWGQLVNEVHYFTMHKWSSQAILDLYYTTASLD